MLQRSRNNITRPPLVNQGLLGIIAVSSSVVVRHHRARTRRGEVVVVQNTRVVHSLGDLNIHTLPPDHTAEKETPVARLAAAAEDGEYQQLLSRR